ncbi:MAG: InlB B-repeat-containing protein, partial [Spirochaetaceae bacterium]
EPATYTVTYDANGRESGTAPDDQTKIEGEDLTLAGNSGDLTRSGYTFAGWNSADDGTGTSYAEGATYGADADVTLYAQWSAIGEPGEAGGVIFYDDEADGTDDIAGARYLEAWTANESGMYEWKTSQTHTTGTSPAVGSGYENTYSAMTGSEHPAANVVRNATHGGHSDWFLPSKNELDLMNQNKEAFGAGFSSLLWSSSESTAERAWFLNLGSVQIVQKDFAGFVRAIRAF